jgi:peptide/nickel transport system substrate-binding protein
MLMKNTKEKNWIVVVSSMLIMLTMLTPLTASFVAIPVNKVAAGISIPTPREETFVVSGWTTFSAIQNPLVGTNYASYTLLCQVMGEFLWYDNYATGERIFWQATGYEYSNDFKTFTIHLRSGVKWNDGTPFTSKDVKFTLELIKNNSKLANSEWANRQIKSISTPDDLTIIIDLNEPDSRTDLKFRATNWGFLMIVPEHIWQNVTSPQLGDIFGRGEHPVPCVLTGPYSIVQLVSKEVGLVVLKRNDNYWAKDVMGVFPEPKYYVVRQSVASDLEYFEVISGDSYDSGDVGDAFPKDLLSSAIKIGKNTTTAEYPNSSPFYLFINCGKYPLNMKEVRWALSYGFEREIFCKSYPFYVPLEPASYPWSPFGMLKKFEYSDVFSKYQLKYNLTKANEILDNLGFTDRDSDGIRETPNGTKLSWEIIVGYDTETYLPMFLHIKDIYSQIGIGITLNGQPYNVIQARVQVGDYELWWDQPHSVSRASRTGEIISLIEDYHSRYYAPIGTTSPGSWSASTQRFTLPEIDSIVNNMSTIAPNDPRVADLSHQAVELFMEYLPAIPIAMGYRIQVWNDRYWTGYPTNDNYYAWPASTNDNWKFIINTIKSTGSKPAITYAYAWVIKAIQAFNGTDQRNYGPFSEGAYVQITKEDADRLIAEGSASYQSPVPGLSQILTAISDTNDNLDTFKSSTAASLTSIQNTVAALNNQVSALTLGLILEAIGIIILAAILLMRRK